MDEKEEAAKNQAVHLSLAEDMANDICEKLPNEQNEMLKQIFIIVDERRKQMIEKAEKKAAWLHETMQQLHDIVKQSCMIQK